MTSLSLALLRPPRFLLLEVYESATVLPHRTLLPYQAPGTCHSDVACAREYEAMHRCHGRRRRISKRWSNGPRPGVGSREEKESDKTKAV